MEIATFGHVGTSATISTDTGPFALEPVTWGTVDAVTGRLVGTAGTYREAVVQMRTAPRGTRRIAPTYAARGIS